MWDFSTSPTAATNLHKNLSSQCLRAFLIKQSTFVFTLTQFNILPLYHSEHISLFLLYPAPLLLAFRFPIRLESFRFQIFDISYAFSFSFSPVDPSASPRLLYFPSLRLLFLSLDLSRNRPLSFCQAGPAIKLHFWSWFLLSAASYSVIFCTFLFPRCPLPPSCYLAPLPFALRFSTLFAGVSTLPSLFRSSPAMTISPTRFHPLLRSVWNSDDAFFVSSRNFLY